jgi:hypothetical protein
MGQNPLGIRLKHDIFVAMEANLLIEIVTIDAFKRRLPRAVDGKDHQTIGLVKRPREIVEKRFGTRITIKLKYHDESMLRPRLSDGLKG